MNSSSSSSSSGRMAPRYVCRDGGVGGSIFCTGTMQARAGCSEPQCKSCWDQAGAGVAPGLAAGRALGLCSALSAASRGNKKKKRSNQSSTLSSVAAPVHRNRRLRFPLSPLLYLSYPSYCFLARSWSSLGPVLKRPISTSLSRPDQPNPA